jgi:benzoate/toluate 1,2-dioxygenase reductase subunit
VTAGSVVVNVSSAATRGIHRIPYSAAKGGVNALTVSLALEYADAGIRVVATASERGWFRAHIDQTLVLSLVRSCWFWDLDSSVGAT